MKTLAKLIILLAISSISAFNSINSRAQDFLPGKFRNYQTNKEATSFFSFPKVTSRGDFFIPKFYDIEGDSILDVIEIYGVDLDSSKILRKREFPAIYLLQLGKDYVRVLVDTAQNGFNGDEQFYNINEKNSLKRFYSKKRENPVENL